MQAVADGQIGSEHVSIKELHNMHHILADKEIDNLMYKNTDRDEVRVFDYDHQLLIKEYYH